jgi:heme-degrading monooxygenase HmoA
MHVIFWTYDVRPGAEAAFETLYGSSGEWAALFRQGKGYLGTELLHAVDVSRRYLTIDRWESEAAGSHFRTTFAGAYETIDRAAEGLTEAETCLGASERDPTFPRGRAGGTNFRLRRRSAA